MKAPSILLLSLLASLSINAQSTPTILLGSSSEDISINTADNYSLKTRTEIYRFENAIASEIADIIDPSLSNYGRILINEELNGLIITEEKEKLSNIISICKELDTKELKEYRHIYNEKIPMKYNKASEVMHLVTDYLSVEGKIQADNNFNMLIVSDNKYSIEKIRKKVEEYDQPQKQIVIDLEIVEIEKQGLAENGIDWDEILAQSWMAFSGNMSTISSTSDILSTKSGEMSQDGFNLTGGISVDQVRDVIRIMQSDGYARVLSTPKVITLTGKRATLWYGKDIIYPELTNSSTDIDVRNDNNTYYSGNYSANYHSDTITSKNESNSYHFRPNDLQVSQNSRNSYRMTKERTAGLELSITPHVGESEIMKIDLNCELTNIINWTDAGLPIVSGQEINNSILGYENQSILIGGLKRTKTIEVTKRVPGLGHILPFLFSRKKKEEVETEIAIFITPRVFDLNEMSRENNRIDISAQAKDEQKK